MQAFPITSHLLRPAWLQAKASFTHTYLVNPTFSVCNEYLLSESKIPTHSTHSIFAILRDNGPFEMMTTMPRRQTMSCVRWGLHSVGWNYDYACMGLDRKDIPQGSALGGLGLLSILCCLSACVLLRIASSHVDFSAGPRLVTTFHCIVLVESFFFLYRV
jgi:hypothetical protein